jgi:hypothetical protein
MGALGVIQDLSNILMIADRQHPSAGQTPLALCFAREGVEVRDRCVAKLVEKAVIKANADQEFVCAESVPSLVAR